MPTSRLFFLNISKQVQFVLKCLMKKEAPLSVKSQASSTRCCLFLRMKVSLVGFTEEELKPFSRRKRCSVKSLGGGQSQLVHSRAEAAPCLAGRERQLKCWEEVRARESKPSTGLLTF